mmetsp:Transcript_1964/g.3769  ORF Transcript_1964/g.3769 Transcript_1964/m.3769 type:complete len:111 (-) Transcript_1964:1059-1391(-)
MTIESLYLDFDRSNFCLLLPALCLQLKKHHERFAGSTITREKSALPSLPLLLLDQLNFLPHNINKLSHKPPLLLRLRTLPQPHRHAIRTLSRIVSTLRVFQHLTRRQFRK